MPFDSAQGFDIYPQLERSASPSPVRSGFSFNGGKVSGPWLFKVDSENVVESLQAEIIRILGDCKPANDVYGSLNRTLPCYNPMYKHMTAAHITSIAGIGESFLVTIDTEDEETECTALTGGFPGHFYYEFGLEFEAVPYQFYRDESIEELELTWHDDDDNETTTLVAAEWARYTDAMWAPNTDIASAQQGQLVYRTDGAVSPHGFTCHGYPRMIIPKAMIQFTWFRVPYEFVTNPDSIWVKFQGRVNQLPWYDFEPGEILYHGFTVTRRYQSPLPKVINWDDTTFLTPRKLCDVTFNLEFTRRPPGVAVPTPANRNWIAAGHNLLPNLGSAAMTTPSVVARVPRGFYYATAPDPPNTIDLDGSSWFPLFQSFPIQLLFRDPSLGL